MTAKCPDCSRRCRRPAFVHHQSVQLQTPAPDPEQLVQRALVAQQDLWTQARGDISLNLIAMYKALGGGWELREGHNFISEENRNAMEERTNWGDLLEPEEQ